MAKNNENLSVAFLFDDTLDSNDAVAQYVRALGAWLSDQGHNVRYLVGETKLKTWSGGKIYSLSKNQKVYFNGNKLSMPLPTPSSRIQSALASGDLDILHVMMPYSPFLAHKAIKLTTADVVIVGTFHIFPAGWLAVAGSKVLRWWCRQSLQKFSQVVSVSAAAASFAESTFKLDTKIIPNPVDISRFKSGSIPKPKCHIVFLGRLVKRKGCILLVKAFAELLKNQPEAKLTIAGDGPQKAKLMRLVNRLGISRQVDFLGHIDERIKPEILASADIACFPSLYGESFGMVLIEAMAANCGVVLAGDNPGYRTVLADQPDLLVDVKNQQLFASRLEELLTDKIKAKRLHEWQQIHVRQYDINVVGCQILDVYYQAIAKAAKNSHN
ncbi:MAG TPA: glycosyltransferase family 4 protein [Candidatus Saccharimonadales bacterium]|nr:glycosyltransferase family 4 protein [Candidatus Saccharimonadales bacterium]